MVTSLYFIGDRELRIYDDRLEVSEKDRTDIVMTDIVMFDKIDNIILNHELEDISIEYDYGYYYAIKFKKEQNKLMLQIYNEIIEAVNNYKDNK